MHFLTDNLPGTPQNWALLVYVLAVLFVVGLMLGLSWVLGGRNTGRAKNDPFESGVVSVGSGHLRISAKFYLVAMFFVIFDLEAVFLYAWAVSLRDVGWAGYVEALIFIAVLLVGLAYIWRLGGLDWAPKPRLQRLRERQAIAAAAADAAAAANINKT